MAQVVQARSAESSTVRIFSTYSTALDLLVGQEQPTGYDYIIHALGDNRRTEYASTFISTAPPFVSTLRQEFSPYETWIQYSHWNLYKEILTHYQPVDENAYTVLWQRTDEIINPLPATCELVNTQEYSLTRTDRHLPGVFEVTLDYAMEYQPIKIPIFSNISRLLVEQNDSSSSLSISLPPHRPSFTFPIVANEDQEPSLRLTTLPKLGTDVVVTKCQATFYPLSEELMDTLR